jgi:hypothetical protein
MHKASLQCVRIWSCLMFETVKQPSRKILGKDGRLIECLTTLHFNGYHPRKAHFYGFSFCEARLSGPRPFGGSTNSKGKCILKYQMNADPLHQPPWCHKAGLLVRDSKIVGSRIRSRLPAPETSKTAVHSFSFFIQVIAWVC